MKGRKRHVLVDSLGLIWGLVVHSASVQDRDGAKLVLIDWVKRTCGRLLEIVTPSGDAKRFQVLPKRWIVERTLGWFGWYRRLNKDYEELTVNSEAMILIGRIHRMARHLKPNDLAREGDL